MVTSFNSVLPPISISAALQTLTGPQPTGPQSTSSSGSSYAQLGTDSYTSSSSVNSALSSVSQSVLAEYESYVSPTQEAWQTLQQSLSSGDVSSAQTALTNYTQSLSNSNLDMSPLTTPSAQFLKDLTDLGSALSTGNLAKAQSLFKAAQQDQPQTVAQAMTAAIANATSDGASDPWWMEKLVGVGSGVAASFTFESAVSTSSTASSSGVSANSGSASGIAVTGAGFNGDLEAIESLIWENNANVGNYLTSQGYSDTAVQGVTSALDISETQSALTGLAYDIGQRGGPSIYEGTISNSGNVTTIDSSGASTQGNTGTSENSLFSSISDNFSWTLTTAAIDPDTGAESVVVSSDAIDTGNVTTATNRTTTAPAGLDASSISDMNQTKNLVESTMGTDTSLSYYSSNISSAKYAVTSSGLSLYA